VCVDLRFVAGVAEEPYLFAVEASTSNAIQSLFEHQRQFLLRDLKQIKLLDSECQTSGMYVKRAKEATKQDIAAACLHFLKH
jgi:hypothetical protein